MPGQRLIFEAFNVDDTAPDTHDSSIYTYRYQNGVRAESISGFSDLRRRLEHVLMEKAYTSEELSRQLSFDRQLLQKILDYLFTYTGEVAALDIPQQPTVYTWADRVADESVREKVALAEIAVYTDDYNVGDLTAIAAYLTNLLVINPPLELIDDTMHKCQHILDAAKLAQAFRPSADLDNRVALIKKKYELLDELRDRVAASIELEDTAENRVDDSAGGPSQEPESANPDMDALPEMEHGGKLYPYETLFLLGSGQNYTGPEMLKTISIDDPELSTMSFANLSTLIVEMSTFTQDLELGSSILGLVETYVGSIFPGKGLNIRFRKAPGIKYKRNVEKLMHEEVLQIRKRGYRIIEK